MLWHAVAMSDSTEILNELRLMELRVRETMGDMRAQLLRAAVALALLVSLFIPVARVQQVGYTDMRLGTLPDLVTAQLLAVLVLAGGLATVGLLALTVTGASGPRRSAAVLAALTLVSAIGVAVGGTSDSGTGQTGEWLYEPSWGLVPLMVTLVLAIVAALRRAPSA